MSNTIYIDANRLNSISKQKSKNEWTYKLNTELELPKGTQISIQNSFINKKGITGGSIEIEKNIIEEITYYYYATEQPHFAPLGHFDEGNEDFNIWARQTWGVDKYNFRGCFDNVATSTTNLEQIAEVVAGTADIAMDDIKRILQGEVFTDDGYAGKNFNPDLVSYGGTNMVCPMVQWNSTDADFSFLEPLAFTLKIYVPKGVYSIGSLAQLIEDQFNGLVFNSGNDTNIKLKRKDDTKRRADDYSNHATDLTGFDGQPYNRPLITEVNAMRRDFKIAGEHPSRPRAPFVDEDIGFMRGFTDMNSFTNLVNYGKYNSTTTSAGDYLWDNCANKGGGDYTNNINSNAGIVPFFFFRQNYDTGSSSDSMGHVKDPDETLFEYQIYGYDSVAHNRRFRQIGTSNFQFRYNSEQSSYTIGGLHNQQRAPSHDRFGIKNNSAGQSVINFKKLNNSALLLDNGAGGIIQTPKAKITRANLIGRLNTPESRSMGIAVMNWSLSTCLKLGDNIKSKTGGGPWVDDGSGTDTPLNLNFLRFGECFSSDEKARDAWKTTLWARLGFQYDDIQNHHYGECFGTQKIYNKVYQDFNGIIHEEGFPNYGFTTDEQIDNSIISTISGQNNPISFKPVGESASSDGFQLNTLDNMALPNLSLGKGSKHLNITGQYAGGLLLSSQQISVSVPDVGDVLASELPTLSESAYYLITSDVCDNYKDNVKRGDVLPLLGIVPKTSLSNQDFIVSENQITQVLSQSKVINKISIKILNADLTEPDLAPNSSILLKIVRPNITPSSLLEMENPKIAKQLEQESQTF